MTGFRPVLAGVLTVLLAPVADGGLSEDAFSACGGLGDPQEAQAFPRCVYEAGRVSRPTETSAFLQELAGQEPKVGWPLFYLGHLHWDETEVASAFFLDAATRFHDTGEFRGEFLARSNRQVLLFKQGRLEEAGQEAEAAANAGENSGNPDLLARGRLVLAQHLLMAGSDLERAYAILTATDESLTSESSYAARRTCLANLGTAAIELGRLMVARRAFQRLLDAALEAEDVSSQAVAWYGLTRTAIENLVEMPDEPRRERALYLASRALVAARDADYAEFQVNSHWVLGVLSRTDDARDHLESCVEVASTPREESYCLNALARYLSSREPAASREVIQKAIALAEEAGDPWSSAFAWRERMRVSWATKQMEAATRDSWAALDRIEALRDLQEEGSEVQAGLFSTWADDYHWFAGRLLEEARQSGRDGLLSEAFAVSERLRARALTDWLRAAGEGSKAGPAAPAAARGPGFATLAQVQRALRPREALLAFQVAPWEDLAGDFGGGSWVIAVTRRTVRAHPLPGRQELRQAVDLYTGLFEQLDGSEAAPSAHLFRQLLAPALEGLPSGVDRLILVPDDALHRLPFAALRRAAKAPPLAATHRISVAPSASLWLGWRHWAPEATLAKDGARPRAGALILAAPAVAGSVSAPTGEEAARSAVTGLPALVHARREGRAVAAALGRGTELARGAAATEALLARADLSRFGILHLAAHAVTDEAHPERSAVVLAPGGLGTRRKLQPGPRAQDGLDTGRANLGAGQDGLLRAGEIAALDLDGKLVVLSSCRTAAGTVLRGEGVMSLGRAFFQAGARTVVASLWPVRDDEAAALFGDFYRHIARGETVAAALQAAQADRITAGVPASAWAAFVVLGDGDLAPVPAPAAPARDLRWIFVAAGAALLALLVLAGLAARSRLALLLASRRSRRQRLSDLASASRPTR